jgi:TolB protein
MAGMRTPFSLVAVSFFLPLSVLAGCRNGSDHLLDERDVTFSISPQGDSLAFSAMGDGRRDLYLLDLKRRIVTRISKSQDDESEPSISPDGKSVVFVARTHRDHGNHIFIQSIDGRNRRQLTAELTSDTSPAFCPDGLRVAFARSRVHSSGRFAAEWDAGDRLCVINVDGSGLREIDTNGLYPIDPRFSPDGKRILFWDTTGLYLVAADGRGAPRRVAGVEGRQAAFSTDGRWLVYMAGRYERELKICLARVDGSGVKHLLSVDGIAAGE